MNPVHPNRRMMLLKSTMLASGLFLPVRLKATSLLKDSMAGRLKKSLKIGMIQVEGSLKEKFAAAKNAGFEGVELDAPGLNVAEVRQAIAQTGLTVDGTVCATHWTVRHSSADAGVRSKALRDLQAALRETHEVGGHTVLLVAGKGEDGTAEEVWTRSVENIAKAIPLAAELGVVIAIENVWNQMGYDHRGGADQTAEPYVRYVDAFGSPWVGMQFDIGNHWKYGAAGDWIRQLGKRVVKLDVKGYSRAQSRFTTIAGSDIDFADVRKSLHEICFHGWVAAEVKPGDETYLKGVANEMNEVFGL